MIGPSYTWPVVISKQRHNIYDFISHFKFLDQVIEHDNIETSKIISLTHIVTHLITHMSDFNGENKENYLPWEMCWI